MAEAQSGEMKALFQTFLSMKECGAFLLVKAKEEQPWEKLCSHNQSSIILENFNIIKN